MGKSCCSTVFPVQESGSVSLEKKKILLLPLGNANSYCYPPGIVGAISFCVNNETYSEHFNILVKEM